MTERGQAHVLAGGGGARNAPGVAGGSSEAQRAARACESAVRFGAAREAPWRGAQIMAASGAARQRRPAASQKQLRDWVRRAHGKHT